MDVGGSSEETVSRRQLYPRVDKKRKMVIILKKGGDRGKTERNRDTNMLVVC